jgi:hypothetical protein
MLDGLKRLFSTTGGSDGQGADWEAITPWASSRQYSFRAVQEEGFVIDGSLGGTPWRLEWGPSQRPYIQGQELRIRSELGLASDLQLVVMNRMLQEKMEKDIFDQYVEGVQTRIDNQTPPEMRWLVMFPKLPGAEMPDLRERYVALASTKTWLVHWLQGPVSQSLAGLKVDPTAPVVLMIGRGRLMLRTPLATAELGPLQAWLRLFETAMREASRVANDIKGSDAPSSQGNPWSSSALPGDERDK